VVHVAVLAVLVASAPSAEVDPPGTIPLRLKTGQTYSIEAPPGSNVLCDDLAVVAPEFAADEKGFLLRAHGAGETLCGVWLAEAKPGGLYRVTVVADTNEKQDAATPVLDAGPARGDAGRAR
jgi:hypothetical protein